MKKFELAMQAGLVPRASDTGKDITLRNASEHKRLEGHLKHLDLQLRGKLVSMQAEILELKASQYAQTKKQKRRTPRLLDSRDRANSEGRLQQQRRGRPRTLTTDGDKLTHPNYSPLVPTPCVPEALDQKDSGSELVLPEINPQQTCCLVGSSSKTSNDRHSYRSDSFKRKKKSGKSPVDNVLLNIPSPSSIYRPSSLPDLSRLGSNGHGGGGVSPRTARKVQFTVPESKVEKNNTRDDKKVEPLIPSEAQSTLAERVNDFIKQKEAPKIEIETENLETPAIEVSEVEKDGAESGTEKNVKENLEGGMDIFYNSMLTKASMEDGFSEDMPDLASLGFMDFNEVIDKRLKQTQEKLPSEEEMRKVRYLRWRHEAPQLDLVKTVFEKRDDLDSAEFKDVDVDDSRLVKANDEDNRLKSCE